MAKVPNFVVKSMVKEAIAKRKFRSSSDVSDALSMVVGWYIDQAVKRAKKTKRQTVYGHDILLP